MRMMRMTMMMKFRCCNRLTSLSIIFIFTTISVVPSAVNSSISTHAHTRTHTHTRTHIYILEYEPRSLHILRDNCFSFKDFMEGGYKRSFVPLTEEILRYALPCLMECSICKKLISTNRKVTFYFYLSKIYGKKYISFCFHASASG